MQLLITACGSRNLPAAKRANIYGMQLASDGKDSEAVVAYLLAARYTDIPDSNRSFYYENAGLSYYTLKKNDSAIYCFNKAARLSPKKSYQWLINKAYVQQVLQHIDTTVKFLLDAYATDSDKLMVNSMLGNIFINQHNDSFYDPVRALRYNARAFHIKTDVNTRFVLAKNYYMLNQTLIALSFFRKIHDDAPDETGYLATLILMEEEMNNKPRADELLDELKQKDTVKYNKISHEKVEPGTHTLIWGD